MRYYLRVSGTVFGLIALGHLLRLLYRVPAELGQWVVPVWVSVIGVLLPGALALWAFRLVRRVRGHSTSQPESPPRPSPTWPDSSRS